MVDIDGILHAMVDLRLPESRKQPMKPNPTQMITICLLLRVLDFGFFGLVS